jgi:hypothetical protein
MKRNMTTAVCYANHRGHGVERYDRDSNLNRGAWVYVCVSFWVRAGVSGLPGAITYKGR